MRGVVRSLATLAVALSAGCGSSPPVHFYTLGDGPGAEKRETRPTAGYALAVGPVTVPDAVDRPQFVIQAAPNQVRLLDEQHWAEPLRSAIARVLSSDLAELLGARTVEFPRDAQIDIKYHVSVDIRSFVSVPGEAATIEAWWTVYGPKDAVKSGRSFVREPTAGSGFDALAAAHRRALKAVSRDIATGVQSMETGR